MQGCSVVQSEAAAIVVVLPHTCVITALSLTSPHSRRWRTGWTRLISKSTQAHCCLMNNTWHQDQARWAAVCLGQGGQTAGHFERMLLSWSRLRMVCSLTLTVPPESLIGTFAVAVLFLRGDRTINLFCCLVVDLGRPVCLLSATHPVLANRPLSLWMTEWLTKRCLAASHTATPSFRYASACPLSTSLSRCVKGMATKAPLNTAQHSQARWTVLRTETAFTFKVIFIRFKPAFSAKRFENGTMFSFLRFGLTQRKHYSR